MEGVTHYLFRQAHHCLFGGADRYYTPFLSPNANLTFTTKEENEIDPTHNAGYPVVPQLLTNRAPYFLWAMLFSSGDAPGTGSSDSTTSGRPCPFKSVSSRLPRPLFRRRAVTPR